MHVISHHYFRKLSCSHLAGQFEGMIAGQLPCATTGMPRDFASTITTECGWEINESRLACNSLKIIEIQVRLQATNRKMQLSSFAFPVNVVTGGSICVLVAFVRFSSVINAETPQDSQ